MRRINWNNIIISIILAGVVTCLVGSGTLFLTSNNTELKTAWGLIVLLLIAILLGIMLYKEGDNQDK